MSLTALRFIQTAETKIDLTLKQFNFANELGVSSYPSLVLVKNERPHLVSSGYLPFEDVKTRIEKSIGLIA